MAESYYGTGKRKTSVARTWLRPGTGVITVNKRSLDDYFGRETAKMIVEQPLVLTDTYGSFDVKVNVTGGGIAGQAAAIPKTSNLLMSLCSSIMIRVVLRSLLLLSIAMVFFP